MRTFKRYILAFLFCIIFKYKLISFLFGSKEINYKYKVQKLPELIIIGEAKCGKNYANY